MLNPREILWAKKFRTLPLIIEIPVKEALNQILFWDSLFVPILNG
jgi:hypothetical protein